MKKVENEYSVLGASAEQMRAYLKNPPSFAKNWKSNPLPLIRSAQLNDRALFSAWLAWGCSVSSFNTVYYSEAEREKSVYVCTNKCTNEILKSNPQAIDWLMDNPNNFVQIIQSLELAHQPNFIHHINWFSVVEKVSSQDLQDFLWYSLNERNKIFELKDLLKITNGSMVPSSIRYNKFSRGYSGFSYLLEADEKIAQKINNLEYGALQVIDSKKTASEGLFLGLGAMIEQIAFNRDCPIEEVFDKKFNYEDWSSLISHMSNLAHRRHSSKNLLQTWDVLVQAGLNITHVDRSKNSLLHVLPMLKLPTDDVLKIANGVIDLKPSLFKLKNHVGERYNEVKGDVNVIRALRAKEEELSLDNAFKHRINAPSMQSEPEEAPVVRKRRM